MKNFKNALHVFIGLASLTTFLGGWVVLAHSPKPIQPAQTAQQLPALEPIPSLSELSQPSSGSNTSFQVVRPRQSGFGFFAPMGTRGS